MLINKIKCHIGIESFALDVHFICIGFIGALDGGSPMSPVDFKKWQCPLSLF